MRKRLASSIYISLIVAELIAISILSTGSTQNFDGRPEFTGTTIREAESPLNHRLKSDLNMRLDGRSGAEIPVYRVKTNSKGFRTEPFSREAGENTTRIIILGDSFTYGLGVNRSERYTDILERKLNNQSDHSFEVLNLGVPAYGMKDYYILLREKGIRYNPDIVVVGWKLSDEISSFERDRIYRRAEQKLNPDSPAGYDRLHQRISEIKRERIREAGSSNSSISRYAREMKKLAERENFSIVFLRVWPGEEDRNKTAKWFESQDLETVSPPEKFSRHEIQEWVISKDNHHFNARGHRWLGEKLFRYFIAKQNFPSR